MQFVGHSARFDPPMWSEYDKRCKLACPVGLFDRVAVVNRFHARYRLARAFRGLNLEGYSAATTVGYDALTRVSLHWSAFEALQNALKIAGKDIPQVVSRYAFDQCLQAVRSHDPDGRFFRFVGDHLTDPRMKAQLEAYLAGEPCTSLLLAKSIRHIFLHGPLTPNARQASPKSVEAICDRLSRSLTTVMDGEFSDRVKRLMVVLEGT